jgi:hypothetical protein
MILQIGKVLSLWLGIVPKMSDDSVEKTLADPKHPIWKVMLGLVAVLSAIWINSN